MIVLNDIKKIDKDTILDIDQLTFDKSGFYVIVGMSGAGKSTLLNILGGIEENYQGQVIIDNNEVEKKDYTNLRKNKIAYIFQEYNLLEGLTVRENMEIALKIANMQWNEEKFVNLMQSLGIKNKIKFLVRELSGGEKQRVAIVRALLKESDIILADEPSGNLDNVNAKEVFEIFKEVSRNRCVILVTHDLNLAKEYATTLIYIEDGKVKFIKHNDKQEKNLLNQETEGTRNFDKSKGKSWEFGYSLSQFKKNIKKNVSVVVAITILLLCCGFIMGISASIHSMYTRINTNVLENDKYKIVNMSDSDICYNEIDNSFIKQVKHKPYVEECVTSYETILKVKTENNNEYKVEYVVLNDSEFMKRRYDVSGKYPKKETDILVNEYFRDNFYKGDRGISGKKIDLGEVTSDITFQCNIVGIVEDKLFNQSAKIYIRKKLIDKIASKKMQGGICISEGANVQTQQVCEIKTMSSDANLLFGRKIKNPDKEVYLNVSDACFYLEKMGYTYTEENVRKGKVSKKAQKELIGKKFDISAQFNIVSTVTVVGVLNKKDTDCITLFAGDELIDKINNMDNYRMTVYVNSIDKTAMKDLEQLCKEYGYTVVKENGGLINSLVSKLTMIIIGISAIGVILVIAAVIIIYVMTKLDIYARMYELGVLKTMGASNKDILKILAIHNLLVGCISAVIAIVTLMITDISKVYRVWNLDGYPIYQSDAKQFILLLFFGIIIAVFSGWIPMVMASRISPKNALKLNA